MAGLCRWNALEALGSPAICWTRSGRLSGHRLTGDQDIESGPEALASRKVGISSYAGATMNAMSIERATLALSATLQNPLAIEGNQCTLPSERRGADKTP